MAAIDQVIEWAETELPDWQGDAVRRILTQDRLSETDKDDLLLMLKDRHGLGDPASPCAMAVPVKKGQISGAPETKVTIVLKALENVNNVNAIPNGSFIPFGNEGLTVIYGDNGAGKSGYARILKRACSARDSSEQIQPNIFAGRGTAGATAIFKIGVEGQADQSITWTDGAAKHDLLTNLIVFDSKSGRVIVDQENDVSFLPYGAHVFEPLISLLKDLHECLENERPDVQKLEYPDVSTESSSGIFLSKISDVTTDIEIETATDWSENDIKRLTQVKNSITEAESPDRAAKIRRIKSVATAVGEVLDEVKKIDAGLSRENVERIRKALEDLIAAEAALAVVAQQSAGKEPLPGVGSASWQALYNAAKEYSLQDAYPGKPFPYAEKDGRCVLCMQPLSDETHGRFHRFQEFMEQSTKQRAEKAAVTIREQVEPLESLNFEKFEDATDIAQEIRARNPETAQKIREYFTAMKDRGGRTLEGIGQKSLPTLGETLPAPLTELEGVQASIQTELQGLEKGLTPLELQALKKEQRELESHQILSTRKIKIKEYLQSLKTLKKYNAAIAETNLVAVSARAKKIISDATTAALRKALRSELDELGANYLQLDTIPTRSEGETLYKLIFTKGVLPKKVSLTDILSEGERTVVAIAGFLAELETSDSKCPIIFDDPVSSLDHKFRDRIAARLAREAQKRQVIIFTHDVAFLVELDDYAARLGNVMVAMQTIRRKGQIPGQSAQGTPWHAMKVIDRLKLLDKKIVTFSSFYMQDMQQYNPAAAECYGMLRETWEAFVEEALLRNVVRRHSSEIQTRRLRELKVTTQDYRIIYFAMGKCSEWMIGHDKSKALDMDRPSPKEIQSDIQQMRGFHGEIRKRVIKVELDRDAAIKAPKASIG